MRTIMVLCVAALAGCAAPRAGCGLIGCVSSGYLAARLGPSIVGQPVTRAIGMAGAPDGSYSSGGFDYLTWRRSQQDGSLGQLSCTESIKAQGGTVVDYRSEGNC